MRTHTITMVSVSLAIAFQACGKWPDRVTSREDIAKLDRSVGALWATELADDDIPALKRLTGLKMIYFGRSLQREALLTDRGLELLAQCGLASLEYLDLGYCPGITSAGLAHLKNLPALRQVMIWHNPQLTNDAVEHLQGIADLRELSLRDCDQITDEALSRIAGMPGIEWLDLRQCDGVTDEGIRQLAKLENPRELLLGECPGVTLPAVQALRAALPSCNVVYPDLDG